MRHKIPALISMGVSVVLMVVVIVLAVSMLRGGGSAKAEASGPPAAPAGDTAGDTTGAGQGVPAAPTAQPGPTAEPTATPWAGPDVQEQSAAMGPEYFADAAFLGNSVLSGLWYYDNEQLLPTDESHWFWADSLTIMAASPYAAQMAGRDFGKIYIEFGINEVTYDKDTLRDAFNTVIDQLQADHPNAIIYLTSVTPVSKYCDENRAFKRSAVLAFNDMLRDIAREQQVWYLDVYPVLCGEDGYLPSDVTNDGVHFTAAHYQYWFDYLKTHYIPDGHTSAAPAMTAVPELPAQGGDSAVG